MLRALHSPPVGEGEVIGGNPEFGCSRLKGHAGFSVTPRAALKESIAVTLGRLRSLPFIVNSLRASSNYPLTYPGDISWLSGRVGKIETSKSFGGTQYNEQTIKPKRHQSRLSRRALGIASREFKRRDETQ
jgi:hypothetical protein